MCVCGVRECAVVSAVRICMCAVYDVHTGTLKTWE